jgi:acetyl esterase
LWTRACGQKQPLLMATNMATNWANLDIELGAAPGVSARIYGAGSAVRSSPLVLHLHGGAFAEGSLDNGETVARLLAEAGAVVVSIDYPLAPRHPFPAALDEASRALAWLHAHRAEWVSRKAGLFVAGEEAGGNLAAGLALMARDQRSPPLAGQILLSPMLDPNMATCSVRQAHAGPVGCKWADGWHDYLGTADKAAHPYASPLGSSRLAGLAPALIITAEDDLMRDESLSYARRLCESGVRVADHVLPAPTGWPCAFNRCVGTEQPWMKAVRDRFRAFFAQTRIGRKPAAALQPVYG